MGHLPLANNVIESDSILIVAETKLDQEMFQALLVNELGETSVFTSSFAVEDIQPTPYTPPTIVLFFASRDRGTFQNSMARIVSRWPAARVIVVLADLRSFLDLTGTHWPIQELVLKEGGLILLASAISAVRTGIASQTA